LKLFLVLAPIVGLALFVLVRALFGRPLSRFSLNVVVALFLLVYLTATASLGVFWVARMDLPVFDWHYLFGYAVILLASAHVALQLPVLAAFVRRAFGKGERKPRAPRSRRALVGLALVVVASASAFLLGRAKRPIRVRPSSDAEPVSENRDLVIERNGKEVEVAEYLYEESSYSRAGILRSVGLAPPRPPDVKPYEGRRRIALPKPRERAGMSYAQVLADVFGNDPALRDEPVPPRAFGLADLSDLLFHTGGVTSRIAESSGLLLRATASSGALYPTDLYVLARSVDHLAPGAYYYDPHAHALVEVGDERAVEAVARACAPGSATANASVFFALGATYDRTVVKYNVRSCRYLPLDAGHLALNLLFSAHGLATDLTFEPWFDDARLAGALGLDPERETALLVAYPGRPRGVSPPRRTSLAPPKDLETRELTRLAQALTSWKLESGPGRDAGARDAEVEERPHVTPGTRVPSFAGADSDAFELVRERRSFREFARRPVEKADLRGILAEAHSVLSRMRGGEIVDVFVVASRVNGVAPGAYRYRAADAELESASPGEHSGAIERAGLDQELLGRAAFVLVWSLSPERLGKLDGARDFRHAALAAGLAGGLAYLGATARGLGVTGVGAFYDGEVNALFGGRRDVRAIYLMGLGARS
jgi:SagB-type dehydrogenase family enzyme